MSDNRETADYLKYLSLGLEIAAAIAFPMLLGYWLDSYFNTNPWLLLVGILVGVVNIFILIFQLSKRLNKE